MSRWLRQSDLKGKIKGKENLKIFPEKKVSGAQFRHLTEVVKCTQRGYKKGKKKNEKKEIKVCKDEKEEEEEAVKIIKRKTENVKD